MHTLTADLQAKLSRIRHVALDMDGTIYRGKTLFEFTNPTLALFTELGVSYSFLTNNSSKSIADYTRQLSAMGIPAEPSQLYTSAQATIECLGADYPEVRRVFVIGTASLKQEFQDAGYTLTRNDPTDAPDAVLVGFDVNLPFADLCRAAYWLRQGLPFIATHPDFVCPTDEPTVIVDCGSICEALTAATGRKPDIVPGKPDPRMLMGLCQRLGYAPDQIAMIGDRLYTDVEMALRAGALGVLVLSGEGTLADVAGASRKPDLVMQDLAEFGQHLKASRAS